MGGRSSESEYKRGLWTEEEDRLLMDYIKVHGKGKWNRVAKETGLKRRGKSCRLRWINYLCPTVKRGDFSEEENDLIIRLHKLLGNRWSLIAGRVPGRTDNQVKNHWNTHLSKQLGVNKGKRKINRLSSIVSREIGGSLMNNPYSNSSSPPFPVCNNEPKSENINEISMSLENANIGLVDTQKPASSHCSDQNSFWFLNNDLNLCTSNWMELLDGPLDLFWQGL